MPRRLAAVMLTATFCPLHALAQVDPDPGALVAASLSVQAELHQIDRQREAAAAPTRRERFTAEREAALWGQPPLSAQQVAASEKEIAGIRDHIAAMQRRIDELEDGIASSKVTDKQQRQARATELAAKAKKLATEQSQVEEPFEARRREARRSVVEDADPFAEMMEDYLTQKVDPDITRTNYTASITNGFITANWKADEGRGDRVVWAQILLRQKPDAKTSDKFDDVYPIVSQTGNYLWVWAGYFEVRFFVDQEDWQRPEEIRELITQYVDLEGLAKLTPQPLADQDPSP